VGYIDQLIAKVIEWVDYGVTFVKQYSGLIVYGVVAMMVAKMLKVKLNIGK
jgi:hypothetical protein